MAEVPLNLAEIEERIAAVRENISELIEHAAAYSGAADEELASRTAFTSGPSIALKVAGSSSPRPIAAKDATKATIISSIWGWWPRSKGRMCACRRMQP